jgi:pyruvate/2-oxoglutarate dehydrogenase complex dihydrolipoamide acyltransferase (E2) component
MRSIFGGSMLLVPILMPQLGESIAEATVKHIGIGVGQEVAADSEIMEVETQKATMAVTVPCAGRVAEVRAEVEVSYAVGATLGFLEVSADEAQRAGIELPEVPTEAPEAQTASAEVEENLHFRYDAADLLTAEGGQPRVEPVLRGLPVPANATGASYISPRLRVRMAELGLNAADLAGVAGSGEGGRVTVEDFERFMASLEQLPMTKASSMRVAVADAMRRSWTRPLATVGITVALDAVLAHRKTLSAKPGPTLYAIRALAVALAESPALAGRLVGGRIVHPKGIDIGFAVEVDDGVLVPMIRNVDRQKLASLIEIYNTLVETGRSKRLPPDAIGTGAATVTNFGTFGIVWATPIPLPEQNLLLGLGAGRKAPLWSDAEQRFLPVTEAQLTLSFDHRILDGGAAGRLLGRIADLLQTPEEL